MKTNAFAICAIMFWFVIPSEAVLQLHPNLARCRFSGYSFSMVETRVDGRVTSRSRRLNTHRGFREIINANKLLALTPEARRTSTNVVRMPHPSRLEDLSVRDQQILVSYRRHQAEGIHQYAITIMESTTVPPELIPSIFMYPIEFPNHTMHIVANSAGKVTDTDLSNHTFELNLISGRWTYSLSCPRQAS